MYVYMFEAIEQGSCAGTSLLMPSKSDILPYDAFEAPELAVLILVLLTALI